MFSDNKKSRQVAEVSSIQNIIAKGTKIIGDLVSEGDFRIDGAIEGSLKTTGKVVVGKSGSINGTMHATDAYFQGSLSGKLVLSGTLTLKSTATIEGEVEVGKLAVEPGAAFNVSCAMKGYKKNLNHAGERESRPKKTA